MVGSRRMSQSKTGSIQELTAPLSQLLSSDAMSDDMGDLHRSTLTPREHQILAQIQEVQRKLEEIRAEKRSAVECDGIDQSIDPDNGDMVVIGQKTDFSKKRLIMASNRLPVSITKSKDGNWEFKMSSGGLVTALSGLKQELPFIWVGWVGIYVPQEEREELSTILINDHGLYPVFLEEELVNNYYNGFCNDILWPLFHYTPLPTFQPGRALKFDTCLWSAYLEANRKFADAIIAAYQPGDLCWIHDYHLMNVPEMLRKSIPDAQIGWFLHTPFPASDIYRILPVRREILQGLLMADLIGFHTYDYARHFLSACSRVVGFQAAPGGVHIDGHFASIGVFPIGIEPEVFSTTLRKPNVTKRISELKKRFQGKRVLIGVDRLDYIKGMPHKLAAIEVLLKKYPKWRDQIVFVQIAVPSRTDVIEYKRLCSEVNQMVGRINGTYGSFEFSPVHYLFRSVSLDELCALYSIADACIVSSVRDGMNLVSYEYVVCQQKRCGVLILSEFAGSAQSLSGAMRVNPWDSEEFADCINRALSLSWTERKLKQENLYRYICRNTASFWGQSFVSGLLVSCEKNSKNKIQNYLHTLDEQLKRFSTSKKRLILLNYGGTLVNSRSVYSSPGDKLMKIMQNLTNNPSNIVYLISEHKKDWLVQHFASIPKLGLFAESGTYFTAHDSASISWDKLQCCSNDSNGWKADLLPIFDEFLRSTPGTDIEMCENSITWLYKNVDNELGLWQARHLENRLNDRLDEIEAENIEIISSKQIVKARRTGCGKGEAVEYLLSKLGDSGNNPVFDFVLCIGDDSTDEEMFGKIKKSRLSISSSTYMVGNSPGGADFFIPSVEGVLSFLEKISHL